MLSFFLTKTDFHSLPLDREHRLFDDLPSYEPVAVADELMDEFLGAADRRRGSGVHAVSLGGQQKPAIAQVLPLADLGRPRRAGGEGRPRLRVHPLGRGGARRLLPASVRLKLYQCFLDAAVSEQIARMTAMRAATENADDMIHDLDRSVQPHAAGPDHDRAGRDHGRRDGLEGSDVSCRCCPMSSTRQLIGREVHGVATRQDRAGDRLDVRRGVSRRTQLPAIYNAVTVDQPNGGVTIHLTGEVQQHLGGGKVRCVALGSTDGLVRGMDVVDTGGAGHRAGRQGDASAACSTCWASPSTAAGPVDGRGVPPDPPRRRRRSPT